MYSPSLPRMSSRRVAVPLGAAVATAAAAADDDDDDDDVAANADAGRGRVVVLLLLLPAASAVVRLLPDPPLRNMDAALLLWPVLRVRELLAGNSGGGCGAFVAEAGELRDRRPFPPLP